MAWIFIAISAHFFWGLANIADKYVLGNKIKNPYVYLVWMVLLGLMSLAIIPFIDFYVPSAELMFWLAVAGALYFYGGLPYVKAVQIEEITRINIWWNLIPVFALIIEWLVLGKSFSSTELAAFAILITGAVLASIHLGQKSFALSRAVPLMALSTLAFAIYAVIFGRITQFVPFAVAFVWINIVMGASALTLFLIRSFRVAFWQESKSISIGSGVLVVGVAVVEKIGVFFNQWALSLAAAALVFSLEGSQVIFVFAIASLISLFAPKVLKEELDFRNVILKFVAIMLMVVGVVVLALG